MPTIVEELVARLTLDTTGFKAGQKDATEGLRRAKDNLGASLKQIDENTKRTTENIRGLGKQALEFFAILTGARGLQEFVANVTKANTELGNLSGTIAATPQALSAWGTAVQTFGGDANALAGSMAKINDMIMNWKNLGKAPDLWFFQMFQKGGVQAPNQSNSPEEWLTRISTAIKNINDTLGSGEAGFYARLLGLDPATTALMESKGADIQKYVERFKSLAPTPEQLEHSRQLTSAWAELAASATAVGRVIVDKMTPGLERAANFTSKILQDMLAIEKSQQGTIDQVTKELAAGTYDPAHTGGRDLRGGWAILQDILHGNKPGSYGRGWGANVGAPESRAPPPSSSSPSATPGSFSPGVATPAPAITTAMGINDDQWRAYEQGVSDIEHARYDQMGGAGGNYAGRYQMGRAEIRETAARLGVAAPSQEQFLKDPALQERFFENYTLDHYNTLMRNPRFAAMSTEEKLAVLGYAHNQGAGGANSYLNTGVAGSDAFGTSGTAYIRSVTQRLNQERAQEAAAQAAYLQAGRAGALNASRAATLAMTASGSVSSTTNNTSRNVTMGDIHIHTPATDGAQFGRDFYDHLDANEMAAMGNYGGI